jgi:hypothetical protein
MSAAPSDEVQGKPKPRYEGKRIALFFGAFLIIGTIIASTAAYYGHLMGNETRARFEADR